MCFAACVSRGRIKGGVRVSKEASGTQMTFTVEFSRKAYKQRHRAAVRAGLIPRAGHLCDALHALVTRAVSAA